MKKFIGIMILAGLTISGCGDKIVEPMSIDKTNHQFLTEGEWVVVDGTISPSITIEVVPGTKLTVNNYWDLLTFAGGGAVLDCDKNNLMICKTDSSVVLDEGPTKCDAADPQTTSGGKWHFEDNQTKINFSSFPMDPSGQPRILGIDLLTSTNMTLTMSYEFKDPLTSTVSVHSIILNYKNTK